MRDVVGRTIYEQVRPHVESALRGEREDFEATITFPDGVTRVLELTYVPQVSGDGRVQGFFLLRHDVSARKQAHEALRASEAQMCRLTDAMPAVIAYCDAEHRYRFVNRKFETWFRRSRADIIGKHARDVLGRGPYEGLRPRI